MQATELLTRLTAWDQRPGPRSHALADALREAAAAGSLPAGTRLPAERELAAALEVSRGTVVRAYDRLRQAGAAVTRHGSGTVLAGRDLRGAERRGAALLEELPAGSILAGMSEDRGPDVVDLRGAAWPGTAGLPDDAFVRTPAELDTFRHESGYRPLGLPVLRRAIAGHLTRQGLATDASQIIVTTGAQQALDLILTTLCEPGDPVLVEELTYPGFLELLTTRRLRARPLPLGRDGVDHLALARALQQRTPPLTYLVPTHHNPTGRTVPGPLRRLIAEQVVETGGVLVDDASLAEVWLDAPPPPPIAASLPDADAHIITVGSASKWLWGGLRVGWVRASGSLLDRLARVKVILDLGTGFEGQLTTASLLDRADEVLTVRREALRSRYDALASALTEQLPGWRFERPTGGLSLWVDLGGAPGDAIAQLAARHGVLVPPARVCAATGRDVGALRLTFAQDEATMRRAVDGLAAAWRDHLAHAAPRAATPIV
ncbi:aminotransferase class I/II-fold pyridoxal phosphate-dependent enzyme [Nitriliruptor alkaliphilus]|uniref:aminotransferase class I/II-fold pyridoxal phosphate-dependent enzyme n=1 Tax=Nitriliruptor alkaliphilus TaxID=427918 RepID=UPI000698E14B